jgi:hypothetical protein
LPMIYVEKAEPMLKALSECKAFVKMSMPINFPRTALRRFERELKRKLSEYVVRFTESPVVSSGPKQEILAFVSNLHLNLSCLSRYRSG